MLGRMRHISPSRLFHGPWVRHVISGVAAVRVEAMAGSAIALRPATTEDLGFAAGLCQRSMWKATGTPLQRRSAAVKSLRVVRDAEKLGQ